MTFLGRGGKNWDTFVSQFSTQSSFYSIWPLEGIPHPTRDRVRFMDPCDHRSLEKFESEIFPCSVKQQNHIIDSKSGSKTMKNKCRYKHNVLTTTVFHYCLLHHVKCMVRSAGPSAHNHRLFREACQENPAHFHQLLFIWTSLLWELFSVAIKRAVGLVPQYPACSCQWGRTVELWCGCYHCWSFPFLFKAQSIPQVFPTESSTASLSLWIP